MLRVLCIAALLLDPCFVLGAGNKDYPITLKVLETDAISFKSDGTKMTTTCTSNVPGEVSCDSTSVSAAQHTELVSLADLADGKLYMISCVLNAGHRFLSGFGQGMQANAGLATVSGCPVSPGTYKARWDRGRLKVAREKNGEFNETTFVVLSSVPRIPPAPTKTEDVATRTLILFASTPPGAEIQLDGSFTGNTPSSIPVSPGEHSIRITKSGYKPWERKVSTVGGTVTISAELEAEPK